MTRDVTLPLWLFLLILLFAAVTFASHFLFPSVRWFFRRRLERAVRRLNRRLQRPIQPFKLARRHDMIQRLLFDPEVARAVHDHARAEDVPVDVAFETARRYAREIVPGFSATLYFSVAIRLAKRISRMLYDVRLERGEEALARIQPGATVIYVMNHRSNMDYVLVTYLAARNDALAYAVGEWARVWPMSRLIRAMGAYFIRRRSRNALYRRVLARYVRLATDGGVAQGIYPEGGLSLDGALQPARLGLLRYITDGFDPDVREVVFVPVALNYDRVLEDRILIAAGAAGTRRFRARITSVLYNTARLFWLKLRGRYRRFGTAAVAYGDPLTLSDFLEGHPPDEKLTEDLAQELMTRIGAVVPVVAVPLVCSVLSAGPMRRDALEAEVGRRLDLLGRASRVSAKDRVERALVLLRSRHIVETGPADGGSEEIRIRPGQEELVRFYANSVAHLLPPADQRISAPANEDAASAGS
ncbi:glycerol-3-phosphate acyltransferase [Aquicoccus sp. SCR17]|nr:glycerol-3-phosphate acyltransferase [Carideicomes alvinocaridis]